MEPAAYKEMVEELKEQWRRLWKERIDDRVRAEGISSQDYSGLYVEKGTVVVATRDYKALNFREILEMHKISDLNRFLSPHPSVGGWGKFIKTAILAQTREKRRRRSELYQADEKKRQQLKKGGRGWLHI